MTAAMLNYRLEIPGLHEAYRRARVKYIYSHACSLTDWRFVDPEQFSELMPASVEDAHAKRKSANIDDLSFCVRNILIPLAGGVDNIGIAGISDAGVSNRMVLWNATGLDLREPRHRVAEFDYGRNRTVIWPQLYMLANDINKAIRIYESKGQP